MNILGYHENIEKYDDIFPFPTFLTKMKYFSSKHVHQNTDNDTLGFNSNNRWHAE